ncbi:MAG TPA: zinc-binding dehydrogenase [Chloroflexota bacterium]|nr:zinc-binding dehydrogenase [Chloroflexota bacterium]
MAGMVRAAVQTGPRAIELRDFPRPAVGPDGGLIRVERCGICGSDVEGYYGHLRADRPPTIPGHESLGIIEELGERAARRLGLRVGDRVAVESWLACHACERCLRGDYKSCAKGRFGHGYTPVSVVPSLWGGYAEYLYLDPTTLLHPVRADIPPDIAVMYNPLGAGVQWAVHLPRLQLGESLLVLGAGQRGLCALIAARMAGAGDVFVTGLARDAAKLELARELGATATIDVEHEDTVEKVLDLTHGSGVDVVLDVTPLATQPVLDALRAVRKGGRVVLAGLKGGGRTLELASDGIIQKALTVIGAFSVDARGYADAIRIIESGRFPLEKLHTHTFGLADTARAIETLAGNIPGEAAIHIAIDPSR